MDSVTIELPKDMQKLCRTCMSLLDENISNEQVLILNDKPTACCEILTDLTNMKVAINDGLPGSLCAQCINQLQIFYIFKEQCLKVNEHLKNFINTVPSFEIDELKLDNKDLNYICWLCNVTFDSLYALTKHSLQHNDNKTLSDKYLTAQIDEYKYQLAQVPQENINLVNERKTAIAEIPIQEEISEENESSGVFIYDPDKDKDNLNLNNCDYEMDYVSDENETKGFDICPICNYCIDLNSEKDLHNCAEVIGQSISKELNEQANKMCNICDRIFKDDLALSLHFLKHALLVESETDPKIFSQYIFCDVCGMSFDTNEELIGHASEHDEIQEVTWQCTKCSLIFESELGLLVHDRDIGHSKEFFWDEFLNKEVTKDNFSCPMCDKVFTSRELLTKHSVQHAIKRIRCRRCKAQFTTVAAYNAHLPSHPNYIHTCTVCGKVLGSKSALKTHIMGLHSSQTPYICQICGKSFKTPNRLHLHKMIHTKEKKFVCSYCGYSTNKGGDLTVHIRIHTEERPYKCSYVNCGRGFKTSSHLSEHVRRHLQIKNYQCNICPMVFGHHSTLKVHLMQHTGEKPFQCKLCNVNFRRKHHLKNHMKQHDSK